MLKSLYSAFKGTTHARAMHRRALLHNPGIVSGIEALKGVGSASGTDEEAPIFLLSAGWRSGSTLLQRLVMSNQQTLIWGEPYDECGLIQTLAETSKAFRPGWPRADYYYDGTPIGSLSSHWVANMFPAPNDWRDGHRALFETLFAYPAKTAGAMRWGIKEVRLTSSHCRYLRWLYPQARFVFLYRNPLDAYRSYCRYGRSWYDTFPDTPVFTPTAFGGHWRRLMEGFLRDAETLDAMLLRYEDLITGGSVVDELEDYLGIVIDRDILGRKLRNSNKVKLDSKGNEQEVKVSGLERWLLRRAVSPLAKELGYHF